MSRAVIFLTILTIFGKILADELISTRCQAQCLHLMDLRLQENPEHRKNLKHHIIQLCKDDATCSVCSQPCGESFETIETCKKQCSMSDDLKTCHDSCDYLQKIYNEKPGTCPMIKNGASRLTECSALCHLDGDCPEAQKCCSYGCNRQCTRADSTQSSRLLPVPRNITIQERKRKRSIIIRFSTGKQTKQQQNENSNLFLIQWRWGLHMESQDMTEWQTVTVRNKPYAILKHLLSPGRFYQFRIAAVSIDGSVGYSRPSEPPFKISKEATAPPPPRDLSLAGSKLTPIGLWNQMVKWTPPQSDLPIKNYQISWSVSTAMEADHFEQMMRKKATMEHAEHEKRSLADDDEIDGIDETRDRHSIVIPSHSTHVEISGLFPKSVYIVEIHASVDSSDGELHGEKGVIFIRTSDAEMSADAENVAKDAEKSEELKVEEIKEIPTATSKLNVEPASFSGGELQTVLSWNCPPVRPNSYTVRVRKTLCREYQPNHHSDTRWHDLRVSECSTHLKGLSFDCDYRVEIATNTGDLVVDGVFSTDSCESTPKTEPIDCATFQTPIQCQVTSDTSAHCHWTRHQQNGETVIGYRILLSSPVETNTTINQPQLREVRYEDLKPAQLYTVEVQSITSRGLGRSVTTQFVTLPHIDQSIIERFPGGEIIELPLESSAMKISTFLIFLIFVRIFWQ